MWLRKIQSPVAIRRCAQKILLVYKTYTARRFLVAASHPSGYEPAPQLAAWSRVVSRALSGLVVLNFLVLCVSGCEEPKLPSPFHANDVTGKYAQADFKLSDQNGKTRTLAEFHGKVVLMFFGYMHCPDVCPTTMADIALALRSLDKDDASKVQVLFVTVDPERDTPALLGQYVAAFDPGFLALSGDATATAKAANAFGVAYAKQPSKTGYSVDHTAGTYIIDTQGKVRLIAPYGQRSEFLAQDVHLLLALH